MSNERYVELLKDNNKDRQTELDQIMETYYQGSMAQRTKALSEIQKTVNQMLMNSKADAACQTDGPHSSEILVQAQVSDEFRSDSKADDISKVLGTSAS